MCLIPQDSYTLYIPPERHNAIQPTIMRNLFFLHGNQSLRFFWSSKSSAAFDRATLGEIDLDSTGGRTPVSPRILLIRRHSSLSRRHAATDWKFLPASGEDSSSPRVAVWPPASKRGVVEPYGVPIWPPASMLDRRSLATTAHWGVHWIIHLLL
jgi:hypothetical protein